MDSYLFLLKKILGGLLMPLPLSLLLLLWALLFLLRRKTRWVGFICVLLATGLLFCASYAPISARLTGPLEQRFATYQPGDTPVDYVSVLGEGHRSNAQQPITSELSPTAIVRLVEGIRIYRLNPGSRLIFTGFEGVPADPVTFPQKLKELAVALGVPEGDILTFSGPRDTAEEAQLIAKKFAGSTLVLVTSAAHMPRAMGLFRAAGLEPIPAPTNHLTHQPTSKLLFPNAKTLLRTQRWLHEMMGLTWSKLRREISEPATQP